MKLVIFTLVTVLFSGTAMAGKTEQPQTAQVNKEKSASEQSKEANDLNRIVCKTQKITGSRLGVKKICMTQAQWNQQNADNRMQLEKDQSMNWHGNGG